MGIPGPAPRGAPICFKNYIIRLAKLVPVPNPTLEFKILKTHSLVVIGIRCSAIKDKSLGTNLHFWHFCAHARRKYNFTCLTSLVGSEPLCLKHFTRLEATDLGKPFPNRNVLIIIICFWKRESISRIREARCNKALTQTILRGQRSWLENKTYCPVFVCFL